MSLTIANSLIGLYEFGMRQKIPISVFAGSSSFKEVILDNFRTVLADAVDSLLDDQNDFWKRNKGWRALPYSPAIKKRNNLTLVVAILSVPRKNK